MIQLKLNVNFIVHCVPSLMISEVSLFRQCKMFVSVCKCCLCLFRQMALRTVASRSLRSKHKVGHFDASHKIGTPAPNLIKLSQLINKRLIK